MNTVDLTLLKLSKIRETNKEVVVLSLRTRFVSLLAVALLAGCSVQGSGTVTGAPTSTAATTSVSSSSGSPVNGASANKQATGLSVSTDSMVIQVKKTQQVQATVTYADGSKDGNVDWSSTDSTIVSVNPTTGVISGIAPGVATIQAKSASNPSLFANVTVTVKPGQVNDVLANVTPSTSAIAVGATVQLSASIQNSNGQQSPNGSWASSNSTVAAVNGTGLVTGVKPGTATITFTSDLDSTVKGTATVTVTGASSTTSSASGTTSTN